MRRQKDRKPSGPRVARTASRVLAVALAAAVAAPIAIRARMLQSDDRQDQDRNWQGHDQDQDHDQDSDDKPIRHLVVIFQENVSFDHYFATYPHATGADGSPF